MDVVTLAMAKKYAKETAEGAGALVGPPGPSGEDGVSPTVSVTEIAGGHRITITDATGTHSFDVMDGVDGQGGGSSELPTIKNAYIDNISAFQGINLPCCVHLVNANLGYTFHDDIVYISTGNGVLTAVTLDNATVTMSINSKTGSLDILKASRLEQRLELIEDDIRYLSQTGGGQTYQFGHGLKLTGNSVSVDTVDDFNGDNTLPMTAAGVETVVGNIEALLGVI